MPARAPVKPTTNFHTSTRLSSPHVASSVTPWTRSRQPTHHSVTTQVAHNVHHAMAALHLVRHPPARIPHNPGPRHPNRVCELTGVHYSGL